MKESVLLWRRDISEVGSKFASDNLEKMEIE